MNKFNLPRRNIAKERRAKRTERRRLQSGGVSSSLKVSGKATSSGKKQRKLHSKWRKAQSQALENGLVSVQDIEMIAADNEAGGSQSVTKGKMKKNKRVIQLKKRTKLRLKQASNKAKSATVPMAADADGDTMMQ